MSTAISVFSTSDGFALAQRQANALSASSLVPTAFRGDVPNCIIALELASRMGASPFMVMQNLHVIHGRPAFSAQFLIAAFNSIGDYSPIRYRSTGEAGKPSWGCVAYTRELATGDLIEGPEVTLAMAKAEGWSTKNGSKWITMPDLMLRYRAAAFLVRTTAPEITMGLRTDDEVIDVGMVDARTVTPTAVASAAAMLDAPAAEPSPEPEEPPAPTAQEELKATLGAISFVARRAEILEHCADWDDDRVYRLLQSLDDCGDDDERGKVLAGVGA